MKKKINLNRGLAIEIGIIFLLWMVSVVLSKPIFDRPLYAHHEWLTAHTLVSMRAFEEWGFWKLLGASVLIPKSYEWPGVDITTLGKIQGIYLSYPSLWLIVPYAILKLLNSITSYVYLSVQFIQIYNLVLNRLICGIVIYYLYLEIIETIAVGGLKPFRKKIIAFLGLVGWMFTPPVMYWTQNVYFCDQAVLLPAYTLFIVCLKCKFKFEELSNWGKAVLFTSAFLACGFDWYGWVSVTVIMFIAFIEKWRSRDGSLFSIKLFLAGYLNSVFFLFAGLLIAGITFFAQIFYYKDGVSQVITTFFQRSGGWVDAQNKPLALDSMLRGIARHWIPYFPRRMWPLLDDWADTSKTINSTDLFVIVLAVIVFLASLYLLYRRSEQKRLTAYIYVLIFWVPLIQLYILKNHSYIHNFSALKMGLSIAFSLIVLPAVTLSHILTDYAATTKFRTRQANISILVFTMALALAIIGSSGIAVIAFADIGSNQSKELGTLVKDIPRDDLIITSDAELFVAPFPPQPMWYANRHIYKYSPILFTSLFYLKSQNITKMKPVFLAFKDTASKSIGNSACQGQWSDLAKKVNGREVVICKTSELRRLFD